MVPAIVGFIHLHNTELLLEHVPMTGLAQTRHRDREQVHLFLGFRGVLGEVLQGMGSEGLFFVSVMPSKAVRAEETYIVSGKNDDMVLLAWLPELRGM